MKTAKDPRHIKRARLVEELFAYSFYQQKISDPQIQEIINNLTDIDKTIAAAAPQWPIEKISKIDLSVLRVALFELMFTQDAPPKVIIDEAVELAKEYGGDNSAPFINGVLGTVIKKYNIINSR